jgi:NADH:ubiquinone oxidoreductase subunit 5 (subunit L)/multisubunit Na+/H+ antiporter MnhA subunit
MIQIADLFVITYIALPLFLGLCLLVFSGILRRWAFGLTLSVTSLLFIVTVVCWSLGWVYQDAGLLLDGTTRVMLVWTSFFAWILSMYAKGYFPSTKESTPFYALSLMSLGVTFFTFLADHMILLAIGWGILGVLLYAMIGLKKGSDVRDAAKKTFIMVGGSDIVMILGLVLLYFLTDTMLFSTMSVTLDMPLASLSLVFLFTGAFAKAGVFPFHSWLPDACQHSYVPVTAFLPLSLDKLLGIYLMIRMIGSIYTINAITSIIIMSVGCVTIFVGVLMALVQHDLKRLLGYHAISQVGYMVLGIGTGTMIGMVGAVYHMMNHTVYKTLLFISGGMIEKFCKTTNLDRLGGLAKVLPITFTVMAIASLSISGVFPFNGYFSKHVIMHGIEVTHELFHLSWWPVFWILAFIGSLLTLSSFVKVMYALFVEKPCQCWKHIKENNGWMLVPMLLLAVLCILLGVTAEGWTNTSFLVPIFNEETHIHFNMFEGWMYLLGFSIFIAFFIGSIARYAKRCNVQGIKCYEKLRNCMGLRNAYDCAEKKYLDVYDLGKKAILSTSNMLRGAHSGLLPTYAFWFVLGTLLFAIYYFQIL